MPRRRIIRFLLLVTVFFSTMAVYRYATAPPKYQPRYRTIAHQFLDLEAKSTSIPEDAYQLLDDVITDVKATAHYDPNITAPAQRQAQLLMVFNTIDSVLTHKNFIFPAGQWTCTLGEALDDHYLTSSELQDALAMPHNARRADWMKDHADQEFHFMACVPGTFIYMGVAQELGFELNLVELPKHVFVRAPIDKDHWVNWDTNRGKSISNEDYAKYWGVDDWQIREKIFLNSLSQQQAESEMYNAIAWHVGDQAIPQFFDSSIKLYRKAIALNPRNSTALAGLANALLFRPAPDSTQQSEAFDLAQRAIALEPDSAENHLTMGYALAAGGQSAAAAAQLQRAIELDPKNTEAPALLPGVAAGQNMYQAWRAWYPWRYWFQYEYGWLYSGLALLAALALIIAWLMRRRRTAKLIDQGERPLILQHAMGAGA